MRTLVLNADGFSELILIDLAAGGAVLPSPSLPRGEIFGFDWTPDGSRLAITVSSWRSPGTIYVYDLASGIETAVTRPAMAGIPIEELVERVISFRARVTTAATGDDEAGTSLRIVSAGADDD